MFARVDNKLCGNLSATQKVIKKELEEMVQKGKDWLPRNRPEQLDLPLSSWVNNQPRVRSEALKILGHMCGLKKRTLINDAKFWTSRVKVDKLSSFSRRILGKIGATKKKEIALEEIISWKCVQTTKNWSKGPASLEALGCGWKDFNIVMTDILYSHYDVHLEYDAKNSRRSSLDFVNDVTTPNINKKPINKKSIVKPLKDVENIDENDDTTESDTEDVSLKENQKKIIVKKKPIQNIFEQYFQEEIDETIEIVDDQKDDLSLENTKPAPKTKHAFVFKKNIIQNSIEQERENDEHADLSTNMSFNEEDREKETESHANTDTDPLTPMLSDWKASRNPEESLSDFNHGTICQVKKKDVFDEKIILQIHDSDAFVDAKLAEVWRDDIDFISVGSIITILKTSGGPQDLILVSVLNQIVYDI